jgi:hypothetical protein
MYETDEEIGRLQLLLDGSMSKAGSHVRSIFGRDHWLSAHQVCEIVQGVKQVAVATANSKGEPRVAPVDSVLFHGRFFISTDLRSFRARHLHKNPHMSLTYFQGADPVIIANGEANFINKDDPEFANLDSEWIKAYGQSVLKLSETVTFIRLDALTMFAYALHPERLSA